MCLLYSDVPKRTYKYNYWKLYFLLSLLISNKPYINPLRNMEYRRKKATMSLNGLSLTNIQFYCKLLIHHIQLNKCQIIYFQWYRGKHLPFRRYYLCHISLAITFFFVNKGRRSFDQYAITNKCRRPVLKQPAIFRSWNRTLLISTRRLLQRPF